MARGVGNDRAAWAVCGVFAIAAGAAIGGDGCGPLFTDQWYNEGVIGPTGIVFGDVDGDSIPDMVVCDTDAGVGVHLGLGDGSFGARTDYLMGVYIPDQGDGLSAVRLGDLNGDGWPDIVACGYQYDQGCDPDDPDCLLRGGDPPLVNNTVSYRLNNGDGTFGAYTDFPTFGDPQDLVLADLDGDGDLDVAITEFDSFLGLSYWFNNGSAVFSFGNSLPISFGGTAIDAGDVDGDGDVDLLVARSFNHVLDVVVNLGGSFAPAVSYPLSGARPGGLDLGDVDGDGDLDAVVTVDSGSRLNVFRNNGLGVFGPVVSVGTGSDPMDVKLADIDGDGDRDAVVACGSSRTVRTHLNDGSGVFAPGDFFVTGGVTTMDVADLDGDGRVDLGMSNNIFNSGYAVRLNTPDGLAGGRDDYNPVSSPTTLSFFDMDNDGDEDIAVGRVSALNPNLAVMVNAGDGTYPTLVTLFTETSPHPATGDVNGDGFADIVTANLSGSSMSVFINNGAGGFLAPVKTELGGAVRTSVLADLDSDGDLDFLTTITASNLVVMMLNDGTGVFSTRVDMPVGDGPDAAGVADMNGDGHTDLVVPRRTADVVTVYLGDGSGGFGPGTDFATDEDPYFVALADLDGDGDPDLVSVNNRIGAADGLSTLSLLFNDGAGSFSGRTDLVVGFLALHVALDDLDADGDTDIVVALSSESGYAVLLNSDGSGTAWSSRRYLDGGMTRWVGLRDLNGDGDPDLISAQSSGHVTVHYNAGCAAQPCLADLAAPFGSLNFFDVAAYIGLYNAQDPAADFAAPFGSLNFFDVAAFIAAYNAGCP